MSGSALFGWGVVVVAASVACMAAGGSATLNGTSLALGSLAVIVGGLWRA